MNDALRDAAHDAISRALDETGIRNRVLRGMCIEVGLQRFADCLAASTLADSQGGAPQALPEPVAYAAGIEANAKGFLDVMIFRKGEFTTPLFSEAQMRAALAASTPADVQMWLADLTNLHAASFRNEGETGDEALKRVRELLKERRAAIRALSSALVQPAATVAEPTYTTNEIADACCAAGVPFLQFEEVELALRAIRRRTATKEAP